MSILDGWMDKAELRDYHGELCIHKCVCVLSCVRGLWYCSYRCTEGQASDSQMYWEHCYQLKQHIPIFLTSLADKVALQLL